jgi:membrane protease YdiL (CAAX protease family)
MQLTMVVLLIILTVAYLALTVASGITTNRRYRGVPVSENERVSVYRQAIASGWAAALVLGTCAVLAGFSLSADLGLSFRLFRFDVSFIYTVILLIIGGAFLVLMLRQLISLITDNNTRRQAWQQLGGGTERNAMLKDISENLLVPRSERERKFFVPLSLTAAICEELTMRGVLFVVIQTVLPGLPLYLIPLIAGVLFGVAHSYQGLGGVLKTGLAGIGFGCLYLACGSLIPGMILHFIVDVTNCFIVPDDLP